MPSYLASALFDTRAEAERAITELRAAGVPDDALSIVTEQDGAATTETGDGEVADEGHGNILRGILGGTQFGDGALGFRARIE
jgi:hypothetical protein